MEPWGNQKELLWFYLPLFLHGHYFQTGHFSFTQVMTVNWEEEIFWFLSYGIALPIQQQKRQPGTVFMVIKLLSYGLIKLLRTDVHIFSSLWGGLEPSHPSTTDCWAFVPSVVILANKCIHLLFLMSTARNKV